MAPHARALPAPASGIHLRRPGTHFRHAPTQALPAVFEWAAYDKLVAFYSSPARGWGLRCSRPILEGQFVVEVIGRCMSEAEHNALEDDTYDVSCCPWPRHPMRHEPQTSYEAQAACHLQAATSVIRGCTVGSLPPTLRILLVRQVRGRIPRRRDGGQAAERRPSDVHRPT